MKLLKKWAAGLLLSFGFLCLTVTVSKLVDGDIAPNQKAEVTDTAMTGIVLAIPALLVAGWLLWSLYQEGQEKTTERNPEENERLQALFFQMLQERNGQITVLHFAMESQLSGKEAQKFLDEKAKEFNANFEVSDRGDVIYRFKV